MKLKKFTKNKQKRIVIGSIVGITLLIGSFTLYKTFALYKEERSFDVLNGTIPYFVYGDVKLAIQIDGEKQTSIPEPKDNYVVQTKCDNGEIEWDYENWGPIIKNITKETRCSLNFVTNNSFQTLGKLLEIDNLDSIDSLITNIDKLIKSKEGMTYLVKSPNLVSELQNSSSYTEDIKKQILNSTAISEDLKYEAGLPCYILNNDKVLKAAGDIILRGTYNGVITNSRAIQFFHNPYQIHVSNSGNSGVLQSENAIDVKKYTKLELNYQHQVDDQTGTLTGTIYFGMYSNINDISDTYEKLIRNLNATEEIAKKGYITTTPIATITGDEKQYFWLSVKHNGELNRNSVNVKINSIALY